MPGWKKMKSETIQGVPIQGDPNVPRTRWWNAWILRQFFWKKIVIFQIRERNFSGEYHVGFRVGKRMEYRIKPLTSRLFGMRLGRENVTIFALRSFDGQPREEVMISISSFYRKRLFRNPPASAVIV
ncbi:MAG: hypothetical protein WC477_01815 [Patescibacteria group bacterium]